MTKEAQHLSADEMAGLAMARADDPERALFEAHATGCGECGEEWRRAARLGALMDSLALPPPPSPKSLARTQARVRAMLAAEPRGKEDAAVGARLTSFTVAAAMAVSVVVGLAMTGPAISEYRLLVAITTIAVAALLPSFALHSERRAIAATLGALALSMGLAVLDYTEFPLIAGHAAGCMSTELLIGALPLVAMLGLSRAAGPRLGAFQTAAAGAAGALAGQGVLLTSCAADQSVLHVLVFHVAGVAIAALLGGGLGSVVARRA